jgi:hypothetical protein
MITCSNYFKESPGLRGMCLALGWLLILAPGPGSWLWLLPVSLSHIIYSFTPSQSPELRAGCNNLSSINSASLSVLSLRCHLSGPISERFPSSNRQSGIPPLSMESKDYTKQQPPNEEEKLEEIDDNGDEAPLPPETIAASYEEVKPEFIQDDGELPVLPGLIVASCERHGVEVDGLDEISDDDDGAPPPPEIQAASHEEVKPVFICEGNGDEERSHVEVEGDEDIAPQPPGMIAALFERKNDEEEKWEEIEDDCVRVPPEMKAAFYDLDTDADTNESEKIVLIEDNFDGIVNRAQDITDLIDGSGTFALGIDTNPLPNGETPENHDSLSNRTLSSNFQPFSATGDEEIGAIAIDPSPQSVSVPNLHISGQGRVEVATDPTPEMMPGPLPSIHPSYLPEATPVEDIPQEPVYDAFPMIPIEDNDAHGQSRRFHKYPVICLISSISAAIIAGVTASIVRSQNEESNIDVSNIVKLPMLIRVIRISYKHWSSGLSFPLWARIGGSRACQFLEIMMMIGWDGRWLYLRMPKL